MRISHDSGEETPRQLRVQEKNKTKKKTVTETTSLVRILAGKRAGLEASRQETRGVCAEGTRSARATA